jgi:hypothetical protein
MKREESYALAQGAWRYQLEVSYEPGSVGFRLTEAVLVDVWSAVYQAAYIE